MVNGGGVGLPLMLHDTLRPDQYEVAHRRLCKNCCVTYYRVDEPEKDLPDGSKFKPSEYCSVCERELYRSVKARVEREKREASMTDAERLEEKRNYMHSLCLRKEPFYNFNVAQNVLQAMARKHKSGKLSVYRCRVILDQDLLQPEEMCRLQDHYHIGGRRPGE